MGALTTRTGAASVGVFAALAAALCACPSALPADPAAPSPRGSQGACAGLDAAACDRAGGLLRAATTFGNVTHEILLDPQSSLAPGRGIVRSDAGTFSLLPTRCAEARRDGAGASAPSRVDATTIDFSYVGVTVDQHLVSADAELAPWVSAGAEASERRIGLVALAFVRDLDPQFFSASDDVAFSGDACTCGRASHFVGAVKTGGLLSYELRVRAGELRGRALEFVKARLAAGDARVTQTVVGGLEVDGLDALAGHPAGEAAATPPRALGFRVKNPVPIAYAVYPLSDVCRFAFPVPEVSPDVVDLGDVPYGTEATRLLHVVNRAAIELRATLGDRTFQVPALGSADIPFTWTPEGQSLGCEPRTYEQTLVFVPRDGSAPVVPKMQTVRVVARARAGKATFTRHEHVDTGVHRKPDYPATAREWTCPPDYAVASCRTQNAACGDGRCLTDGYAVNAGPADNGCRFGCTGPEGLLPGFSSNFCRFDAVMECRLRCR